MGHSEGDIGDAGNVMCGLGRGHWGLRVCGVGEGSGGATALVWARSGLLAAAFCEAVGNVRPQGSGEALEQNQ